MLLTQLRRVFLFCCLTAFNWSMQLQLTFSSMDCLKKALIGWILLAAKSVPFDVSKLYLLNFFLWNFSKILRTKFFQSSVSIKLGFPCESLGMFLAESFFVRAFLLLIGIFYSNFDKFWKTTKIYLWPVLIFGP